GAGRGQHPPRSAGVRRQRRVPGAARLLHRRQRHPNTTQQFTGGSRVYRLAYAASTAILVLFVTGVWAAWRRGAAIALPLLLILYIPATLAFVLTNMRYSITVQPLLFMFVA